MAVTYEPIATATVTSATQATVTFSSIPGTYTDLYVVAFARSDRNAANDILRIGFNSDTSASNYSATFIASNTSNGTAYSGRYVRGDYYGPIFPGITSATAGAGIFGVVLINVNNYLNSTTNKTYLARGNYPNLDLGATVGLWNSTSAITSIVLSAAFGNLVTDSTFTLYGIKAA